ncbi:MAG: hypothetical protein HY053_00950 [Proteobacteria bacterium]|nr:hypothetical protein [Pseudomonadota bacterium]
MPQRYSERAPFNDWWYWSECLVKRFRTMEELYREEGETDRAFEIGELAKKLKDNCMVPVEAIRKGMKTEEQKIEVKRLEEEAIYNAANMFRDVLFNFPFMSSSIQEFLGVKWDELKWDEDEEEVDEFGAPKKKKRRSSGDTRILELFWGPKARQDEGIRSGKVEDGGLPGILNNLMMAEKSSSNRQPTEYGQFVQAAANQQFLNVQKHEKAGVMVNFKPPGGI